MIDLYTWSTSNGRKVSIALEEMDLPYAVHPIDIYKGEQFRPDFLALSPNNRIPAIVDREAGRTLFESGAILVYLADKTGRFMPTGPARWDVLQWLMWQMGGIGPMLGQAAHFLQYNPGKSAYAEERYGAEARRLYGVLDRRLAETEYVAAADYTIADMAVWPWISRYEHQRIDLAEFPNVARWYAALAARPAVQRGYRVPDDTVSPPLPQAA